MLESVISQNGNVLTSTSASGNQWYNASGAIAGATGKNFSITANGNYYCIVTIAGCVSDTSNKLNAVYNGISKLDNNESWLVYPNPAPGYFYCNTTGLKMDDLKLNVYTITGVLAKSVSITQGEQKISTVELSSGTYMIELRSNTIAERKLIYIQN